MKHSGSGLIAIDTGVRPDPPFPQEIAKRGDIAEFSGKSQGRLRRAIAMIERKALETSAFVCLTYPAEFPTDPAVYKRHNKRFAQECRRKWALCGIWVLEFQGRGAPHFHWLLIGLDVARIVEFRKWAAAAWFKIVGSGDEKHLLAGISADLVKFPSRATSYMAKYLSKGSQKLGAEAAGGKVGRYWGYCNKSAIPFGELVEIELTPEQARRAMRIGRKRVKALCWESRWAILKKRIQPFWSAAGFISQAEFRRCCDDARSGSLVKVTYSGNVKVDGKVQWATVESSTNAISFLEYVQGAGGFPRRWRMRQNQVLNLFCDADTFTASLLKHLETHEHGNQSIQAIPAGHYHPRDRRVGSSSSVPAGTSRSVERGGDRISGRVHGIRGRDSGDHGGCFPGAGETGDAPQGAAQGDVGRDNLARSGSSRRALRVYTLHDPHAPF